MDHSHNELEVSRNEYTLKPFLVLVSPFQMHVFRAAMSMCRSSRLLLMVFVVAVVVAAAVVVLCCLLLLFFSKMLSWALVFPHIILSHCIQADTNTAV